MDMLADEANEAWEMEEERERYGNMRGEVGSTAPAWSGPEGVAWPSGHQVGPSHRALLMPEVCCMKQGYIVATDSN